MDQNNYLLHWLKVTAITITAVALISLAALRLNAISYNTVDYSKYKFNCSSHDALLKIKTMRETSSVCEQQDYKRTVIKKKKKKSYTALPALVDAVIRLIYI